VLVFSSHSSVFSGTLFPFLGEAVAIRIKAAATASGLRKIARALSQSGKYGRDALALQVAQQYVQSFGNIAKKGNTMLLPVDAASPAK
jgi:stomatin-like protein 2